MCRRPMHIDGFTDALYRAVIGALRDRRFSAANDKTAFARWLKVRQKVVCYGDNTISCFRFGCSNNGLIACECHASLYVYQPFVKVNIFPTQPNTSFRRIPV